MALIRWDNWVGESAAAVEDVTFFAESWVAPDGAESVFVRGERVDDSDGLSAVIFGAASFLDANILNRVTRAEKYLVVDEMLLDLAVWAERLILVDIMPVQPPPVTAPRLQQQVKYRVELEEP